jgi:hypothetical protein
MCCEYKYTNQQTNFTFIRIKELIDNNKLNLDPKYQRSVVWTDDKMMSLIDSIIHRYYYPPIILNLINGYYNCIDGKQRITSIMKFLNNKIYYSINDDKIYFKDFDEQSKELFLTTQFQVCLYTELDYHVEVEIFRRVQKGVIMTTMEIMKSHNSELICDIINKTNNYINIWKKYNISTKREHYLNYILRILMMQYKKEKGFITVTIVEIEKFVKNYTKNIDHENEFYINLKTLFNFLIEHEDNLKSNNNKILSIVEVLLLYKMILDNNIILYTDNYIYYCTNMYRKPTTYTPKLLNSAYNEMISIIFDE